MGAATDPRRVAFGHYALTRYTKGAGLLVTLLLFLLALWFPLALRGIAGPAAEIFELVKATFFTLAGLTAGYGLASSDV
jgi:hypothetical protein